jgi:hypothetical protein
MSTLSTTSPKKEISDVLGPLFGIFSVENTPPDEGNLVEVFVEERNHLK